eukprot:3915751-Pleurochrysis_carterae.AAC.1
MRQSSQSTDWLPEGPGYLMYNSVPEDSPPLAKAKADTSWARLSVEGTIRAWYRYMVVPNASELAKVKAEWKSVFNSLPPPDGDVNALPESMKLRWFELPKFTESSRQHARRAAMSSSAADVAGISLSLENPIVNPITGPGRSSADVQREMRAHREMERNEDGSSPDGGLSP